MTPLPIKKRLYFYLLLAALTVLTPYILTIIFIIATGDRISGMKLGIFPSLITVQLVFGILFIQDKRLKKILWTIILTALIFGLVLLLLTNDVIKTGWDIYGYWDLAVSNFLSGLVVWETFYQVSITLNKSTIKK